MIGIRVEIFPVGFARQILAYKNRCLLDMMYQQHSPELSLIDSPWSDTYYTFSMRYHTHYLGWFVEQRLLLEKLIMHNLGKYALGKATLLTVRRRQVVQLCWRILYVEDLFLSELWRHFSLPDSLTCIR